MFALNFPSLFGLSQPLYENWFGFTWIRILSIWSTTWNGSKFSGRGFPWITREEDRKRGLRWWWWWVPLPHVPALQVPHRASAESLLEVLLALFCQHVEGPAAAGKGPREWGYRHQECRAYKFNMICGRPRVDGFWVANPAQDDCPFPFVEPMLMSRVWWIYFLSCVWCVRMSPSGLTCETGYLSLPGKPEIVAMRNVARYIWDRHEHYSNGARGFPVLRVDLCDSWAAKFVERITFSGFMRSNYCFIKL